MSSIRRIILERSSGRVVLFTILYAAEGAPIGFIWWALPTLLRTADVPVERITALTAVVVLPWVFKFLWAPAIDLLRGRRWGFRAWIVLTQMLMGVSLIPLVWLDPVQRFDAWRLLLLVHAFAAATQDVAIDALAITSVPAAERGLLNGSMQAGMLIGRSVFGGGAVLAAALLGSAWVVAALIAWIWLSLGVVLLLEEPVAAPRSRDTGAGFRRALQSALGRRSTWLGLAFALTSAAAFEATGQLAGPFLVDRAVPTATIGMFFGVPVVAAMLGGGLLGGAIADRWGRLRSAGLFLAGFVVTIVLLAIADWSGAGHPRLLISLLTVMYFFVGLFTAASYAVFMDLTDPRLGATQFSAFMAGTNGCESWSVWAGGRLAAGPGYPAAFLAMSAASLASLVLLKPLSMVLRSTRPAAPDPAEYAQP